MTKKTIRRKAVWGSNVRVGIALAVLVLVPLLIAGCSQVRQGRASSFLVMTSLSGTNGCGGAGSGGVLSSDVECGTGTANLSVIADSGSASFQLQLKDPAVDAPSPVNAITLTQYHVDYTRSDGHNVQGVDVPYSFDGAVTETISSTGNVGFTLVRLQAKEEAPLAAIVTNNIPLTTIATVTFYGHDQTGRQVSVSGKIEITFANFSS